MPERDDDSDADIRALMNELIILSSQRRAMTKRINGGLRKLQAYRIDTRIVRKMMNRKAWLGNPLEEYRRMATEWKGDKRQIDMFPHA